MWNAALGKGRGTGSPAIAALGLLLLLNGEELQGGDEDKCVATVSLAVGTLSEADFAAWLRRHVRVSQGGVHEPRASYG